MLNNNFPLVKENLTKKKINCNPLCSRRNSRIKSISQCFKDCIWATQIWFGSQLIINFKDVKQSFIDWLKDSILTHDEYNTIMIMNIIYTIQKERNKKMFEDKSIPAEEAIRRNNQGTVTSLNLLKDKSRNGVRTIMKNPQRIKRSNNIIVMNTNLNSKNQDKMMKELYDNTNPNKNHNLNVKKTKQLTRNNTHQIKGKLPVNSREVNPNTQNTQIQKTSHDMKQESQKRNNQIINNQNKNKGPNQTTNIKNKQINIISTPASKNGKQNKRNDKISTKEELTINKIIFYQIVKHNHFEVGESTTNKKENTQLNENLRNNMQNINPKHTISSNKRDKTINQNSKTYRNTDRLEEDIAKRWNFLEKWWIKCNSDVSLNMGVSGSEKTN